MGFFEFYSITKTATLDFEIAVEIWKTYFKGRVHFYDEFVEYLDQIQEKKIVKVHRDLWQLTYEFMKSVTNLGDYSQNDGWPLMLDDFVVFCKGKNEMK